MQEQETVFADVEPLLRAAGLALVDFSLSRHRASVQVRATVYAAGGTGTLECAKASRIIADRLAVLLGVEDPHIEVQSPGIERLLRTPREFSIFAGRNVKVLPVNESEWIRGRIVAVEGTRLSLLTKEGPTTFEIDAVAKARLDSTQEGD